MPQHDDHDDLAALDFSAHEPGSDDHGAALDFSVSDDDSGAESAVDALDEYAPAEAEDTGTELDAIHSVTEATEEEDEEDAVQLFTVTNPSDTVSVSAAMDGSIQRIELSANVTRMSEPQLADEILVLADLARQKGLAGQHTYLTGNAFVSDLIRDMSPDGSVGGEVIHDFVENFIELPTEEQAAEAQAKVFATRYAHDHD
jgi:hypothetical protein